MGSDTTLRLNKVEAHSLLLSKIEALLRKDFVSVLIHKHENTIRIEVTDKEQLIIK